MEHIKATAEKLIKQWRDKKQTENPDTLKDNLKTFLTKQEQRHIKYYSLKDSQITIGVDSSAWLYTLNQKKAQLLKNLNKISGQENKFKQIYLQLDAS
ncbi:MAG: DciA family protein [Candidatus Omnitrophota bacterium]